MNRLRLPVSLALVTMLMLSMAPATAPASAGDRMVRAVNSMRAAHGLGQLREARALRRSARAHARRMLRGDFFAHPARLRVPRFDRVGEVLELHGGSRARVRRTVRAWRRSPGHRGVLLSRAYRRIGAARATGSYRGRRVTIWVVRVGRR